MALFLTLEDHDANPPSTWMVTKAGRGARYDHIWLLTTSDGGATLDTFTTKTAAEAAKVDGLLVRIYDEEGRWMAGETLPGHRSYAECLAERQRIAERWPTPAP